jgi:hypothetical protein
MKVIKFNSDFSTIGHLSQYPESIIKNEPMIFSGSKDFAFENGGPITKEFLSKLPDKDFIIDSRVHMLMPGFYPCIPGWHLDDVPRTREDGQPEHDHPAYKSENIMTIIGDASITEFVRGELELEDIGFKEGSVYGKWNADINKQLSQANCRISVKKAPELALIHFPFGAFHRGTPATKNGWRFFIRANFNTARKPVNEMRRQVNVYLPVPEQGW